jgi:hypothetical protein
MIHFKIDNRFLKDNELNKRHKAIKRVINNTINANFMDYPLLDIIITNKKSNRVLGRFYKTRAIKGKEYRINHYNNNKPCIVLFYSFINSYYGKHNVKGIKAIFIHEFIHYKQFINNEPLKHGHGLSHKANKNVNIQLNQMVNIIKG